MTELEDANYNDIKATVLSLDIPMTYFLCKHFGKCSKNSNHTCIGCGVWIKKYIDSDVHNWIEKLTNMYNDRYHLIDPKLVFNYKTIERDPDREEEILHDMNGTWYVIEDFSNKDHHRCRMSTNDKCSDREHIVYSSNDMRECEVYMDRINNAFSEVKVIPITLDDTLKSVNKNPFEDANKELNNLFGAILDNERIPYTDRLSTISKICKIIIGKDEE